MGGFGFMLLGSVVAGLAYAWSLFHREWQKCPRCKGNPRNSGTVWTSAHRHCGRCAGSPGEVVRWGVRVFRNRRAKELVAGTGRRVVWRG